MKIFTKIIILFFIFFIFYIILFIFSEKNVVKIYNFSWKNIDFDLKINEKTFSNWKLENKNSSKINLEEKWYFEWKVSVFIDWKENIISWYYWLYCIENFKIFVFENNIFKIKLFPVC